MIHVAEFNGGQIRLEISNQDEFIRQFKKARREYKKKPGTWKIRVIGTDRVTAPIQKLIDECSGQKTEAALAPPVESPESNGKPVRQRPGGPLTSN